MTALPLDEIAHADALTYLAGLPSASVDMVLCDLPYGTTACSWDEIIPFAPMWEQFRRVTKPRAAIVLTASQPFTSKLVMSNPAMFKYSWVWVKSKATDFARAKLKPMGQHEDVLVFSSGSVANGAHEMMLYYPQGLRRVDRLERNHSNLGGESLRGKSFIGRNASNFGANNKLNQPTYIQEYEGYPSTVLRFDSAYNTQHPTQKPVSLFEYLIRSYTQANDVVLDCCMGSGTTAVAARQCGRHFVGCDSSPEYVHLARERLAQPWQPVLAGFA